MKYHALFVNFEKAAKFEIVVCCKIYVALNGLKSRMASGTSRPTKHKIISTTDFAKIHSN